MMNNKIILAFFLVLTIQCSGQSDTLTNLDWLKQDVYNYLQANDKASTTRRTEFILLFLEVDSLNGTVKSIHLMSDPENNDGTYQALKSITTNSFKEWKGAEFCGKVLVMPIYSGGYGKDRKINYLEGGWYIPFEALKCEYAKAGNKFIILPKFIYDWPAYDKQDKMH